jgi:hypothetical protein
MTVQFEKLLLSVQVEPIKKAMEATMALDITA